MYVIIFDSFCELLLEDFEMFLELRSLLSTKKTEYRQQIPFSHREQQTHETFSNQINVNDSSVLGKSKFYGVVQNYWLCTSKYFISLIFYKEACLVRAYMIYAILTIPQPSSQFKHFFLQVLFYHYCTHQSSLEVCNKIHD